MPSIEMTSVYVYVYKCCGVFCVILEYMLKFLQLQRLYPITIKQFLHGMINSSDLQSFDTILQIITCKLIFKKTEKFGAMTLWLRGFYINFALTSAVLRSPRHKAVV